jgi:muconolactone delta-isomerase
MRGTFLLLAAVSRTVGFIPTINFGRTPLYHPTRASIDAAAEDTDASRARIDAVSARRDGVERQADGAEATEDTAEEDAETAILRQLEDEVTRLDAARQECERTITRLFAELDAAQIERAKTVQAYERAYNRYQQTKGIQEQLQASRRKAEARKQSLDSVEDVAAAAAALKSRPQSAPIAGSYVPDGLSAEEWAELQARERAPKGDLGSWGSKVGGESEPQRGDLMSQPTIWTNPSAFFNERVVGEPSIQSDESRPNIFDLDEDESDN